MTHIPTLPGLYYQQVPARPVPSPLRSDVAGFVGRTRRGETNRAIRVEGWRDYIERFGGLDQGAPMTYAIRGYFENGGEVAWVVRVLCSDGSLATGRWRVASDNVSNGESLPLLGPEARKSEQLVHKIEASSPGRWANGLRVTIEYAFDRLRNIQSFMFNVRAEREPVERFRVQLAATDDRHKLGSAVAQRSKLIRLRTDTALPPTDLVPSEPGGANGRDLTAQMPSHFRWNDVILQYPDDESARTDAGFAEYRAGLAHLLDEPEIALVALPGAPADLSLTAAQAQSLYCEAIAGAAELQDRLVLVDVPSPEGNEEDAVRFADSLRSSVASPSDQRSAAVYHPWVRVHDPLGGDITPLRTVPPSGHIAGVISREDRERGAHHTPSNVLIEDAVDIETSFDAVAGGRLSEANVNAIRCVPGRGLTVWGGRTLTFARDGRFLGHRRFVHRLVRSVRRVAEPLVFETNGPEQWLTLVRAVSSVLLEAFRTNALQGSRPEEAFRVRCDEKTNPLTEREQGRMLCEIDVALAAPMEFITLRVAVSQTGQVEVFDE